MFGALGVIGVKLQFIASFAQREISGRILLMKDASEQVVVEVFPGWIG